MQKKQKNDVSLGTQPIEFLSHNPTNNQKILLATEENIDYTYIYN
jgi:hypothetical protein